MAEEELIPAVEDAVRTVHTEVRAAVNAAHTEVRCHMFIICLHYFTPSPPGLSFPKYKIKNKVCNY